MYYDTSVGPIAFLKNWWPVLSVFAFGAIIIGEFVVGPDRGPDLGPQRAREWAERFHAEGPVDCVPQWVSTYRCAVVRGGQVIGLECWDRGCSLQRGGM